MNQTTIQEVTSQYYRILMRDTGEVLVDGLETQAEAEATRSLLENSRNIYETAENFNYLYTPEQAREINRLEMWGQ